VLHAEQKHGLGERWACRLVNQPRGTQRYQPTQRADIRSIAFVFVLSLGAGIFFGLAPLLSAIQGNLSESLNERGLGTMRGSSSTRFRNVLTVLEVAFALVLTVAASLLTETLSHLLQTDAGFNSEHVLTFELSLPSSRYASEEQIVALYQHVLRRRSHWQPAAPRQEPIEQASTRMSSLTIALPHLFPTPYYQT
jgi:hypothetical protein